MIEGIKLKIKLKPEDYDHIMQSKVMGDKDYVSLDNSTQWIKEKVKGDITKEKLDK